MLEIFLLLLLTLTEAVGYNQTDYVIHFERLEIASFNEKHARFSSHNYKYNRTHAVANITYWYKHDFDNNISVDIQAYKFQSNEYRLFPITFNINMCDSIRKNDFGLQNIYNCGNAARCPIKKGVYIICNWTPDYFKFPPYIPSGQYRLDMKLIYLSEEFVHMQAFAKIEYTNLIKAFNG